MSVQAGFQTYCDVIDGIAAMPAASGRGITYCDADGKGRFVPYAQFGAEVKALGRKLLARGLRPGDRVAIVVPQPEEFVPTFLGAVSAGLVPVPLYPPLALGRLEAYLDGTARIMRAAAADMLITTAQLANILWTAAAKVPTLRDVVTYEAVMKDPLPAPTDVVRPRPGDALFLQFTSGSTAEPKGVVVTHQSLLANAKAITGPLGLDVDPERDKTASWLPLYHDMGLIGFLLAPLYIQMSAVFIPTIAFVKRPSLWMDVHHETRANMAFAPNFAYARLAKRVADADLARWDLSHIRVLGCGAEPIQAATMRAFNERFARAGLRPTALLPSYGMAEATLAMSMIPLDEELRVDVVDQAAATTRGEAQPVSAPAEGQKVLEYVGCGRPMEDHEIGVFDDDGRRLGERKIGELWFRGPSVASGYFLNPEATRAVFRDDGWLRTGDLGYVAGGQVYVTGRKKDLIIVHGRNYSPQSIEWVVEEVDGLRKGNVVAFSVPGKDTEEVVVVCEVAERDAEARATLAQKIKGHVSARMSLGVADVVLVGPGELPKTTSGKLQRRKTRDQYLARTLGAEGVRIAGSRAARWALARHVVAGFASRLGHRATRLWPRWPMTLLARRFGQEGE